MNIEELKNLIPGFVANRLSATERKAVEDALPRSEELRKELGFWKRLKAATVAEAKYLAEGHLTPGQIVEYVDGNDIQAKLLYEKHLQECNACREEMELVQRAFGKNEPVVVPGGESWTARLAKYFRPAYAIPVAVGLALIVFFVLEKRTPAALDHQAKQARSDTAQQNLTPPATPPKAMAYLLLHPHVAMRATTGAERESLLHYDTAKSHVALMLVAPRSDVALTYIATLSSPSGIQWNIRDSLVSIARDASGDTVKTEIAMSVFGNEEGRWKVHMKEVLKPDARGQVERATYDFYFRVKRK